VLEELSNPTQATQERSVGVVKVNSQSQNMKDIKDILENYSEQPSQEVWERLSARLDAEMPVHQTRKSVWKWASVAATVIIVGGGVLFGVMRHQHNNEGVTAMNTTEKTVGAQPQEAVVETQNVASLQEEEPSTVVETSERASVGEEEPPANVETRSRASQPSETQPAPAATSTPQTNVRQEVLPPNSTLAKQLAADPVLRNLTDGSVEWSKPAHLSIPNLFTPNGDGVNDLFVIEGMEQYSDPRLVIRDKNGRVVYQSNHYQNSWDGGNCPDGVYHYEFTFAYNGIENQAVGKVRIMRS